MKHAGISVIRKALFCLYFVRKTVIAQSVNTDKV